MIIEVANGGNTNGLAANKQEYLRGLGYNVEYISTFSGNRTDETRIFVREEGQGEDLRELFSGSVIIVDTDGTMIANGTDIKIILGLNQK